MAGLIVIADMSDVDRVLWGRNLDIPRRTQHTVHKIGKATLLPCLRGVALVGISLRARSGILDLGKRCVHSGI